MPKWTEEQQQAINLEGTNIIVSAGAGSGKTAVLSERVIRKLEQGVQIDHLLILTFTKAAAFEMMIRIRNKIKERPHLKEQLEKIDSAYITTFDSFSLALVKKYHYLLNVKRNISIINQSIMDIERKKMLDNIFEEYYKKQDPAFLKMLDSFTVKDDAEIKSLILSMNSKLDLKYEKLAYLTTYVQTFFKDEKLEEVMNDFQTFLCEKILFIKSTLEELYEYVEEEYQQTLEGEFQNLFASKTYDEIKMSCPIAIKMLPRNSSDEAKALKEILSQQIKELKQYLIYENQEEIWELYKETKDVVEIIIKIILELDNNVYIYKYERDAYEFTDISKMAIKLVKENQEIRDELKYFFNEIMVDEYQDTSDLQELFISAIENDNIYMVGDIKQSIYRFRNANPYIFKNKYDKYANQNGGRKIDLMKNFRSRKEVLQNINYIFDYIMDDFLGGCRYQEEHRMVFGNTMYEENKKDEQSANLEVYNYQADKSFGFKKDEIEAFIILNDIEEKIKNKYQVIDKETFKLRDCTYQDFAILVDRASQFELYKKIFTYKNIPMAVYKDASITKEDDIYIFSNLLKLIYLSYHNIFNEEFRYAYLSVARSYLTDMQDSEIFKSLKDNNYLTSEICEKMKPILKAYPHLNGVTLLGMVIDTYNFYERQVLVGNMEHLIARIEYLKTVFEEMGSLGYSIDEAILNFCHMVEEGYDIKLSMVEDTKDAVKIMTIHKSKGLEFPILYMAGLSNKFNIRDLNEKFLFDNKYGILIPFYQNKELTHIAKFLMKDQYIKEEISEKIRLFYVALTRAREKMIFVVGNDKEQETEHEVMVRLKKRLQYRSFLDILKSIWSNLEIYKKEIDLETLGCTKDYNFVKASNFESTLKKGKERFIYKELKNKQEEIEESSYSKKTRELLTPDNYEAIELGKRFHSIFENLNFINPDYSQLNSFEKKCVQKFLDNQVLTGLENATIYKEYEFMFSENNQMKHGIIDLLIVFPDHILIIDYKLKQVRDKAYEKQLKGYREYIKSKMNQKIEIYLYSILDGEFTLVS